MRIPNIRTKRKVAKALRRHARTIAGWTRWSTKTSKMRPHTANAFLLGVMLDRSVPADRAWDAADWICRAVGDEGDVTALWQELSTMEPRRLSGFLRYGYGGQAFHRHYKTFARLLPEAADHLLAEYGGDPRRIWNNQRDVNEVRRRLDAIPNIGAALARMAVLILARHHGLVGGKKAKRHLDVKPDVHVRRVFQRAGIIPAGASLRAVVDAARQLAPDFPGALDAPAWEVGRNWCRPSRPNCSECPIGAECPRVGIRRKSGAVNRAVPARRLR
jgi:endonuclease-3